MSAVPVPDADTLARLARMALAEDLGDRGDVTTRALFPEPRGGRAVLLARHPLVVAGLPVAGAVFRLLDPGARMEQAVAEGAETPAGALLATVQADLRALLEGERSALNFLQRMCGIATATRQAVREIEGTGAVILDTRKTAPGLRALDKYAVAVGGGRNHRMGLFDAAMIKDTHRAAAGSMKEAVRAIRQRGTPAEAITVEVRSVEELREAVAAGAGRALLDNMGEDEMRACVAEGKGKVVLEASGGLRPGRLRAVASTGVDCLSVGWLTHSAPAADVAMELREGA